MKSNSKILIHHHAVAFADGNTIQVQSFIATWAIALSEYFDQVGLLLYVSPAPLGKQDTSIQKDNITLHPLGKVVKGKKVTSKDVVKKTCQEVGSLYDILLIRGMTPQQMLVFQNCPAPDKAFLLVGSIKDSKPKLKLYWLNIFLRFKYYQRISQLKAIAKQCQVFANSPHIVSELKNSLGINAGFMPTNTISKNDFVPLQPKEINLTPEVLFCGRVVQDKGIEELIQAIGILKKNNRDVHLTIVGGVSNSYQKHLEAIADADGTKTQIRFEGFVTFGEALLAYYQKADLYVLPSWHEGFPHSIWEAAASCTPIITTRVGGIPGLMTEEEVFFISTKNPNAVAEKITHALDHKEEADQKVNTVYEKAKSFTVEKCAERIFNKLGSVQAVLNG